jgi:acyl carrier protein
MKMAKISNELKQYIYDNILMGEDEEELSDDASLLDMGVLDSTGVLELIAFVEKRYKIRVDDKDILPENFESLKNIENFLTKKFGQVAFS